MDTNLNLVSGLQLNHPNYSNTCCFLESSIITHYTLYSNHGPSGAFCWYLLHVCFWSGSLGSVRTSKNHRPRIHIRQGDPFSTNITIGDWTIHMNPMAEVDHALWACNLRSLSSSLSLCARHVVTVRWTRWRKPTEGVGKSRVSWDRLRMCFSFLTTVVAMKPTNKCRSKETMIRGNGERTCQVGQRETYIYIYRCIYTHKLQIPTAKLDGK